MDLENAAQSGFHQNLIFYRRQKAGHRSADGINVARKRGKRESPFGTTECLGDHPVIFVNQLNRSPDLRRSGVIDYRPQKVAGNGQKQFGGGTVCRG